MKLVRKRKGGYKWTAAHRAAYKRTMALKRLTKSGIVHTPAHLDAKPIERMKSTIPSEVRDIDSIFGRYQRLSPIGKMFVIKQLTSRPSPSEIPFD